MTPLAVATDAARFGGKAAGLARLLAWGLPVPPGVALDWRTVADLSAGARLDVPVPGPWAVRSSAIGEDGATASFAGQHLTRLGVEEAELVAAIAAVRASGSAAGARAYRAGLGLSAETRMGIVIQTLVAAERSYVAFGVDPVTRRDLVVIEGVRGPGGPLVSGEVNPDRWRVTPDGLLRSREPGDVPSGAPDDEVRRVAALVREIGHRAGGPQDVELSVAGGVTWVLQARPVSTR